MLTPEDHARITAAVADAEAGTSGDIFCVLAGEVSSYREVPIAWGAMAALLIPSAVMAVSLTPLLDLATGGGWTAAEPGNLTHQVGLALTAFVAAQLVLFAVVALVTGFAPIRRLVTPGFLKRHRVKKAAFHHFVAAHSHAHGSETGVLIFVALVERRVEILADTAIHAKVGDAVWREAAAAVQAGMKQPDPTAGIEKAIAICGAALKTHFPSTAPRTETHRPVDD
ncbi:MAG TPA: TPM domain-containing protein [Caulobacteraceae bacterium]|jgi:putative membrane protein|nr:TPM domain-containing protein [Caulobacteraceae bacterium]